MNNFNAMKPHALAIALLLAFSPLSGNAQSSKANDKIEAAKIGLISERLGLSPKQAQDFWPIYNQYTQERKQNQHVFREARKKFDPQTATDDDTNKMLKLSHGVKEKQLKIDQEFSDRLLTVINSRQLLSLHKAEQDFRQMILRKLEQRRTQQKHREQFKRQNNERMRNKRNN